MQHQVTSWDQTERNMFFFSCAAIYLFTYEIYLWGKFYTIVKVDNEDK